ncbi:hypothetical protein HMI54_007757 [Coelomomyces lativittatus]|nr:hypothetical protein HMI56_002947 [Coelomomyces lativittatus]KAJ1503818.1 hypothetical protein HMI54_007757 [Coelomomyces lativittatus]KAJ1506631.1 hypothetical protein HMI55_001091 [Coelomomyces lativittatus]
MQNVIHEMKQFNPQDLDYFEYMARQLNLKKTIEAWLALHEPYEFLNLHEINVNSHLTHSPMRHKRESSICFKNDSHNDVLNKVSSIHETKFSVLPIVNQNEEWRRLQIEEVMKSIDALTEANKVKKGVKKVKNGFKKMKKSIVKAFRKFKDSVKDVMTSLPRS